MRTMSFAFSPGMQLVLLALSVVSTYVNCYYSTSLVLLLNGEVTTRRRKALLVALCPLIYQAYVWGFTLIGVTNTVPYNAQVLFTITNPALMLVFLFMLVKILGISLNRSIPTTVEIYLFINITRLLARLIEHVFLRQTGPQFNYLLNALAVLVYISISTFTFLGIRYLLKRYHCVVKAHENPAYKPLARKLLFVFGQFCLIYLASAVVPALKANFGTLDYLYTIVVLTLSMVLYVLFQAYVSQCEIISSKDAHIGTLANAYDESRALRHDFGNVLQTYSGYISLGDLDALGQYHQQQVVRVRNVDQQIALKKRMDECPELFQLLVSKLNYAGKLIVSLDLSIPTSIRAWHMPLGDLCRCLGCLLDNAIEAAAESGPRRVSFYFDEKPDGRQLFIISNSNQGDVDLEKCMLADYTTKKGYSGTGLPSVRKVLGRHANCSLRLSSYQGEYSAYLEVLPKQAASAAPAATEQRIPETT